MLDEKGFKRRTYQEILEGKIQRAQELFGADIDTSELTPLGKFIRINAYDQALTEEEAERIYYSIFPDTADGTSLDRLCVFFGLTRNPAEAARYIVTVVGQAGETVPAGFLVGTEGGVTYYNTEDVVIGDNGMCEIIVDCTEAGDIGNVNCSEITRVVNPVAYVTSVSGKTAVKSGSEIESDYVLRQRVKAARGGLGSCTENAIIAALLSVPTVVSANVAANYTDEVDEHGRPPRSFECYITGGEDYHAEIAETIFDKKPIGIKTHGTITQKVTDIGGREHNIYFSHTENVAIYVYMEITATTEYEADGGKQITNKLKTYIDNLGVGADVILSSLYGHIHSVAGVEEVRVLKLSTDGETFVADSIEISPYQSPICSNVEVVLNVV